jgi:hypothetical protein
MIYFTTVSVQTFHSKEHLIEKANVTELRKTNTGLQVNISHTVFTDYLQ